MSGGAAARLCKDKRSDPMFGCEEAFVAQLAFTCSPRTELALPIGGVK